MAATPFDIELDEMTLARARRGDMAACERIYRLYQQPVYSVAFRICQCPETAREITQEAFITALRRLRQFRGDAPFWAWLRRLAVNHSISRLRRLPKVQTVDLQDHHAPSEPEQDRVDLSMDLETALARLGPDDRAVVWLHDVEGYNHREIANLFGKTESFSKTRLSRARVRLRQLLESGSGAIASRGAAAG
jgi:RNA polymerase sigma-70 factor (ECF subfamily)